jgi:hypothetical protein
MSKKKTVPAADRAAATVKKGMRTDSLKVSVTRTICSGMQQAPEWSSAPAVQAAVKAWAAEADALDANAKAIADLRNQLKALEAKQHTVRRDWQVAKSQVMVAVTSFCGGSADRVKAFTLDVMEHGRLGALAAPADFVVKPGTALGELLLTWLRGLARHGFVAQHATDPNNPATISGAIPCTRARLVLGGLVPGANVSCRVAAIDPASPTGMSPWSAWVVGTVR